MRETSGQVVCCSSSFCTLEESGTYRTCMRVPVCGFQAKRGTAPGRRSNSITRLLVSSEHAPVSGSHGGRVMGRYRCHSIAWRLMHVHACTVRRSQAVRSWGLRRCAMPPCMLPEQPPCMHARGRRHHMYVPACSRSCANANGCFACEFGTAYPKRDRRGCMRGQPDPTSRKTGKCSETSPFET